MTIQDYRPRLIVDISEDHKKKLDLYLGDFGRKKEVMHVILDDLFRLFERFGADVVIGALITRSISIKDTSKLKLED